MGPGTIGVGLVRGNASLPRGAGAGKAIR